MRSDRLRLRDVRRTTPFRLSLLLGALFLAGVLAALTLSYLLTARELTARSDRILFARANSLLQTSPEALPARIRAEIANATPGFSYFALQGRDGEPIVGNIGVFAPRQPGRPFNIDAKPGEHGPVRVLTVRDASGETIVLGRDTTQIRNLRHSLLVILAVSGVVSVTGVAVLGVVLSVPPLRRVRDLHRASRAIAGGDLSRRMPIGGRHDELDQFAGTVNLMVEEVERVVAQVKTATDAIAHDLRTPLTRVRASLHRMRHADGLGPAHAAIAEQAVADLDAVVERFGALLRIAELEASGRRSGLERIALAPLLEAAWELYQPLAEERGVAFNLASDSDVWIEADPGLLLEAVGNLIDNATKFASTRFELRGGVEGGAPFVEVRDDGPGIPADEREAVLRRFHRARGASGVEGTGLGLAVVTAIVHLHGFALDLRDADPGLAARIRLSPVVE